MSRQSLGRSDLINNKTDVMLETKHWFGSSHSRVRKRLVLAIVIIRLVNLN